MKGLIRNSCKIIGTSGLILFLKKIIRYLFWRLFGSVFFYLICWLKGLRDSTVDIKKAVDFTFSFNYVGVSIKPAQIRDEITKLLNCIRNNKPRVILEIGTAGGGTLFLFTRIADPEAIIISIDLPGGLFGGGYPSWKSPLYRSFARQKQRIYLVRGDSHNVDTLKKVEEILSDYEVDFLFFDGDHSYKGIKSDFEMYSPLVKKGGIIVFHDIAPHDKVHDPSGTTIGVDRFWNEIKRNYINERLEIVKDWTQGWGGIGILYI